MVVQCGDFFQLVFVIMNSEVDYLIDGVVMLFVVFYFDEECVVEEVGCEI